MANNRQILVLNAGSSSLKIGLFDFDAQQQIEKQLDTQDVSWPSTPEKEAESGTAPAISSHSTALRHLLDKIDLTQVSGVGHRVVHGGEHFRDAVRIDEGVKQAIRDLGKVAPLHNPVALEVIEAAQAMLPTIPHVAAFDTAFHHTLPPSEYLYALPYEWYERWRVRRFGFHGLSYAYCAPKAAQILQRPLDQTRMVICHLGSGCSLCAVQNGQSVATTMGFTPLEGVMMGTRSGDVDPGLLLYLIDHENQTTASLNDALNHASGLKGISGISGDMREIMTAMQSGNMRAQLAFDMFTARLRTHIAAMIATLGGVDAIVFTGGIGEHSADVRSAVIGPLGWIGAALDESANHADPFDRDIATTDSKVRVLVIRTNEEMVVARETRRLIASAQ